MTLLATLAPLIREATSSIQFTISRSEAGRLQVLLIPHLSNSPESETDPVLAPLNAALARPLRFDIPGDANPDTFVTESLAGISSVRATIESELSAYAAAAETAKKAAQEAQASKVAATKSKAATPATPATTASIVTEVAASEEDGDNQAVVATVATPVSDLFD